MSGELSVRFILFRPKKGPPMKSIRRVTDSGVPQQVRILVMWS